MAVNCIDSQKRYLNFIFFQYKICLLFLKYLFFDCYILLVNRTPLMAACIDGHEDIVELLLENNADVSLVDKDGLTAYQLAESYKNPGYLFHLGFALGISQIM